MEAIKKRIIFILLIVFSFLISGYDFVSGSEIGEQKAEQVLSCVSDKTADKLKELFCEHSLAFPNIEDQINEVTQFFEGSVASYDSISVSESMATKSNLVPDLGLGLRIPNVVTDCDKKYDIWIYYIHTWPEDESRIGISEINIVDKNGDECSIGEFESISDR